MKIGDRVPDVLGLDENGKQITRESLAGKKVVLYVYPKDNTSGCTAEACSLKERYDELQTAGYVVVGVSKDSAASHRKFIDKYALPFPLIADTDTALLQALGAWGEKSLYGKKYMGAFRTTYLLNEEGIVEKIFTPKEINTKTHAQQILDYIKG